MRQILVVREFDDFSRILSENNFSVINCPAIEINELKNLAEFNQKMSQLNSYDGIFITSANAAKIFRRKFVERTDGFSGKVYLLGKRSYDVLKDVKLDLFFDNAAHTAQEMLDKIAPEDLKNKRFLFVRGETSLRIIPEFLKKIALVEVVPVYRTEKAKIDENKIEQLRKKLKDGEIAAACFFSPSAAQSFIEQFEPEILHQTFIATIGKTTAGFFEQRNLSVDFVSSKSSAECFASELIDFLKLRTKGFRE